MNLNQRIAEKVRNFMVPEADGGNHERAYASVKSFCDDQRAKGLGASAPEEIVAALILDEVRRHRDEKRRER